MFSSSKEICRHYKSVSVYTDFSVNCLSVFLPTYRLSVFLPTYCLSACGCLSVFLPAVCLPSLPVSLPTCLHHSFSYVMYHVQQGFNCYFIIFLPSTGESNSSDELCFSHVCFVENEVRIQLFLMRKKLSVGFLMWCVWSSTDQTKRLCCYSFKK